MVVLGSGRTDAGVHAAGQVIAFDADWHHSPDDLHRALNATLPAAIAVLDLTEAAPGFHPRYDAASRQYVYTIYNAPVRHPLYARFALHVAGPLEAAAMNAAVATLVGVHDFAAFGLPTAGPVTVREMFEARCEAEPPAVRVLLEANGFLYRMVRSIVGTLLAVGRGAMTLEQFRAVLDSRDRAQAGAPVPPHGLCLTGVRYERRPSSAPAGHLRGMDL